MNLMSPPKMSVDEFLVWAMTRPGKYELIDGVVFQMSPERVRHLKAKGAAYIALVSAVGKLDATAAACHVLPDGATVRIDKTTAYQPDVIVYSGLEQDDDSIEISTPLIVVEVVSPSSKKGDTSFKFAGYMGLPSLMHYIVLEADRKIIMHHRRVSNTKFISTPVENGILRLDPPGLDIPVADFFAKA